MAMRDDEIAEQLEKVKAIELQHLFLAASAVNAENYLGMVRNTHTHTRARTARGRLTHTHTHTHAHIRTHARTHTHTHIFGEESGHRLPYLAQISSGANTGN